MAKAPKSAYGSNHTVGALSLCQTLAVVAESNPNEPVVMEVDGKFYSITHTNEWIGDKLVLHSTPTQGRERPKLEPITKEGKDKLKWLKPVIRQVVKTLSHLSQMETYYGMGG